MAEGEEIVASAEVVISEVVMAESDEIVASAEEVISEVGMTERDEIVGNTEEAILISVELDDSTVWVKVIVLVVVMQTVAVGLSVGAALATTSCSVVTGRVKTLSRFLAVNLFVTHSIAFFERLQSLLMGSTTLLAWLPASSAASS